MSQVQISNVVGLARFPRGVLLVGSCIAHVASWVLLLIGLTWGSMFHFRLALITVYSAIAIDMRLMVRVFMRRTTEIIALWQEDVVAYRRSQPSLRLVDPPEEGMDTPPPLGRERPTQA